MISPFSRPRGCGIVLTDPTYYIIPSLEECDQLTNESTCFVEDFIIGRKGKGKIHFPGTTDVYGLNLDKIGESAMPTTMGVVM